MTTHVFIVDEYTFPLHLQYKFAGTGAGEKDEHIGLLADIKRTRPEDKVIFYLVGVGFYGIFKIASDGYVFKDPNYLKDGLRKKLIYRIFIEPDEVYSKFVTEWETLEKLPLYAQDVIWSLIYRKLKGNRGCTPITIDEANRLFEMIRKQNQNKRLSYTSKDALIWGKGSKEIKVLAGESGKYKYKGQPSSYLNILAEINRRYNNKRAYEAYLQAYFTGNIGEKADLNPICGSKNDIIWIGNEVACGVGMQKIDIFTITADERQNKEYRLIELKDEIVTPTITTQLLRYVNWTSSYLKGAINSNIQPVVVAPAFEKSERRLKNWDEVRRAFLDFNDKHLAKEIRYFELRISQTRIFFRQVSY